jgi:hypothetical protein
MDIVDISRYYDVRINGFFVHNIIQGIVFLLEEEELGGNRGSRHGGGESPILLVDRGAPWEVIYNPT